jgi:hypothetical protein
MVVEGKGWAALFLFFSSFVYRKREKRKGSKERERRVKGAYYENRRGGRKAKKYGCNVFRHTHTCTSPILSISS